MLKRRFDAVLFDLDGTLVDSAPDLAAAANALRDAHGLAPLPYEQLRPMVGSGARGMVGVAFGVAPGEPRFEELKARFLDTYAGCLLQRTVLFEHMQGLLAALEAAPLPWGIVTNKAARFTAPLVVGLGLAERAATVISGDTTAHAKPHPQPLLEAARRLGVLPGNCLYVGDDLRDMQAGRAAGMAVAAATWGYLGHSEAVHDWPADTWVASGQELLTWLQMP